MFGRLAILVTLVACNDPDVERLTAIKSKVCACKTASCAEQEMKAVPLHPIKSTHRTQVIARDLLDCVMRLHEAERPTTDPDEVEPSELEPSDRPEGAPPAIAPPAIAPPAIAPPAIAPPPPVTSPRSAAPASPGTPRSPR